MVKRLVEKYDRVFQRVFEILPGVVTWSVILSPIWLGRIAPLAVAFFLTFLIIYWVYRALIHLIGVSIGYRRYQAELQVDWSEKVKELWGYDRLKHLIIIPAVNEPYEVLEDSFASFAAQKFPKDQVFISFSAEEKYSERVLKDIERIKKKFGRKLGTVWTTAHPYGLPGEAVGAAANRTWAAKRALKEIKKLGLDNNDFLVTTLDADMRFHPQYLPRLSHAFLTEPNRLDKFFQTALYLFDNNLWEVPPLMRIQANSLSLAVLASWVAEPEHKDTWSCYSVALPTVIKAGFWNPAIGVDDTTFYWNAFLKKEGKFDGSHFYIPVYADAVQDRGLLKTHIAQYKQLLRWGWGIIVFPIAMKGFLTTKVPLGLKLSKTYHLIEKFAIWYTLAFLITFGFTALALVNPEIKLTSLGYLLPKISGVVLTAALALILPVSIYRNKITLAPPRHWPWWKKLWIWVEGPLVILNLLVYNFLPFLDAQTRLMFGKRLEFWPTPKMRSKNVV
ncbi:hypothetical protein A2890_02140 [candidate division WWE3 bacterium RIFCSPLOWO2_01_FULL_53_14]|uniref:Uncharacterized protein n=1 Tax=candidate division WWE3 bacterium RIFCSPLOWO2_01_FULL_53_14 TaxID=1802628 RepID=A0A1F4VR51_UNCKA|nr:MAG: hypothetical protein A2890_02140 [candidate division WWE3 bacterium RIFCSPLOWO2_01_FULL_53_14]